MTGTGRGFSLDDSTNLKIIEESAKLHINKSAFLRFLVWKYVNDNKKIGNEEGSK